MAYTGNKSGLYVEEEKYTPHRPFMRLAWTLIAAVVLLFVLLFAYRAYGDALPHIEKQNMERWIAPQRCDDRCCEEAYANITIDRTKANEIGGMDSLLPGMKLTDDMFLVTIVHPQTDEVRILIFKRENEKYWRTIYDFELPTK